MACSITRSRSERSPPPARAPFAASDGEPPSTPAARPRAMDPRAFPSWARSSSAPLASIVAARESLFSKTDSMASRTEDSSARHPSRSPAEPYRVTRLYRNRSTGNAAEYGTMTTLRENASACARRRTEYAASGIAATATGAVRAGSRYAATSRARPATIRSTSRAAGSRSSGSSQPSRTSSLLAVSRPKWIARSSILPSGSIK